jgi:anti-sigma B factor antagonist
MAPTDAASRFSDVLAGSRERPYSSECAIVGEAGVVAVSGEIDLYTASRFKEDVDEVIATAPGDLILDLSDLDLLDSSALVVMLGTLRRLTDEGRWLILVVTQRHLMRVLTVTGLHTRFRIVPSRRRALQQVVAPIHSRRVA